MNILIDGRIWSLFSAGVGTFFTCAIMEWAKQRKNDIFYIILPKGLDTRYELSSIPDNIKLLDYSKQFPKRLPNIIILQLLVPYLCRKLHINMYYSPVPHLPYFIPSKVKTMVTIHDVVNIEMAQTMSWTNQLATSIFFGQAIKKANFLWTNSYYTKSKVEAYYPSRHCKEIFTGDTLFRLSIGRTDLPTGSYREMVKSLKRLSELEGEYYIYPGHGEASMLSYEKNFNPYLKQVI